MMTEIKKVLMSLGCVCVFLIVVEEFLQQGQTKDRRAHSVKWISDFEYVRFQPLNVSKPSNVNRFDRLSSLEMLHMDQETEDGSSDKKPELNRLDKIVRKAPKVVDELNVVEEPSVLIEPKDIEEPKIAQELNVVQIPKVVQEPKNKPNTVVQISSRRNKTVNSDTELGKVVNMLTLNGISTISDSRLDKFMKISSKNGTASPSGILDKIMKIPLNVSADSTFDTRLQKGKIWVPNIVRGLTPSSIELDKDMNVSAISVSRKVSSRELNEVEERRLRLSPFIYQEDEHANSQLPRQSQKKSPFKLVTHYLPWDLSRLGLKRFDGCQYANCRYVNNMSQADAILFRASLVRDHKIPNFFRPKGQRWIFYTFDPAIKQYGLDRPDVKSNFNWTLTYQLDSDISMPFGVLRRIPTASRDFEAVYNRKNRDAAWFVSHCITWSKREQYVERMRKIMQVDIFGKCGNMTCGPIHYRTNDSQECLPMLTHHYKFYFAFENSFCKDYVSEKFFKLFQDVDVIPVVRGGFDYKKYLPSGIFVDSSDFKTPEALARYLVQLGNNKQEYIDMLKRKSQWVESAQTSFQCRVCEALHTAAPGSHYYPNLKEKFNGNPASCWSPKDLG